MTLVQWLKRSAMRPVDRAAALLRGYCEKHDNCERCRFSGASGCLIWGLPADWEIGESKKEDK